MLDGEGEAKLLTGFDPRNIILENKRLDNTIVAFQVLFTTVLFLT